MTDDVPEFRKQNPLGVILIEVRKQVVDGHLQDFDRSAGWENKQETVGRDLNKAQPFDLP